MRPPDIQPRDLRGRRPVSPHDMARRLEHLEHRVAELYRLLLDIREQVEALKEREKKRP